MHTLDHCAFPERPFRFFRKRWGRGCLSTCRLTDHVSISVSFDSLRMFLKMIHKKKASGCEPRWGACSFFFNYARDLAIALEFVCVAFFSGSAAPQKDRHNVAFLEQLVNMTLCPAEQKNASSPCPQWPAHRSSWLHAGSRKGATLVKIRTEIRVEQGESLQEAVVPDHTSSLQNEAELLGF